MGEYFILRLPSQEGKDDLGSEEVKIYWTGLGSTQFHFISSPLKLQGVEIEIEFILLYIASFEL